VYPYGAEPHGLLAKVFNFFEKKFEVSTDPQADPLDKHIATFYAKGKENTSSMLAPVAVAEECAILLSLAREKYGRRSFHEYNERGMLCLMAMRRDQPLNVFLKDRYKYDAKADSHAFCISADEVDIASSIVMRGIETTENVSLELNGRDARGVQGIPQDVRDAHTEASDEDDLTASTPDSAPLHIDPAVLKAVRSAFTCNGCFVVVPELPSCAPPNVKSAFLHLYRCDLGVALALEPQFTLSPAGTLFGAGTIQELKGQDPLVCFVKPHEADWVALKGNLMCAGLAAGDGQTPSYTAACAGQIYNGSQHQIKKMSTVFRILYTLLIGVHGREFVTSGKKDCPEHDMLAALELFRKDAKVKKANAAKGIPQSAEFGALEAFCQGENNLSRLHELLCTLGESYNEAELLRQVPTTDLSLPSDLSPAPGSLD
jgi:hypothetical protein